MHFPSVSLIIPCYNEESRIPLLVHGIQEFADQWQGDFEVIIVDDGSQDRTFATLSQDLFLLNLISDQKLKIIQQANQGKGAALQKGVLAARKDFILTLDADMATSPLEIIQWLQVKKSFRSDEILIGSREMNRAQVKDHWHREFAGHMFNLILRTITGLKIKDTQCGFKLYPTQLGKMIFASLQTPGWAHDVEILKRAEKKGFIITEMPIHWEAVAGSKINLLKDSFRMFVEVCKISMMKMEP